MELRAQRLCKAYGDQAVLREVSLSVKGGEVLAVLGRSGCGKTTLLKLLSGLLAPDSGAVLVEGQPVSGPDADRLMVFQGLDQLFPWLTLTQNILYALKRTRPELARGAARARAARCLHEMGLGDAGDKYPSRLSGGMKQRGALARAMAIAPKALLLDEPFSSLDVHSRAQARDALRALLRASGAAAVFVTHDIEEALGLAPRVALMTPERRGIERLYECGEPGLKRVLAERISLSRDIP
ncbi:ATP-binding cassette domain-containing protein [Bacillota bacterium Meth-B3]